MGLLDRFFNKTGIADEEGPDGNWDPEYDGGDYEEDPGDAGGYAPEPVSEEPYDDGPARFARSQGDISEARREAAPVRRGRGSMEIEMIRPSSVDDARDITDMILSGRAVIVNLEGVRVETAQRIMDFASGACYAVGGNMKPVSERVIMISPKSIDLSGDFS
ncbi:MAG: cell division protein SepF [Lachnospiraceae bacterium]|nr:cell division protein SepF [Lachnospiraceae bacterium]